MFLVDFRSVNHSKKSATLASYLSVCALFLPLFCLLLDKKISKSTLPTV